ncbi:MAG: YigZ family protein [Clostridium sp.]|uniref:YigZ family protein n=1 Tax=Clostridium sp. TaxID=1506 RepID=UPI002FC9FD24
MIKEDYTILKDMEVSFEERKSLFICNIKRISNEAEAMEFINSIKAKYKDATHNVFAYVTNNKISMRYSDDGEPQGTAGPPALEVLKREGINDVAVVVTRYFGGILLGAGGLIRAYGASCKQGVDAAVKVKRVEGVNFTITCDYEKYGKINNYLQGLNIKVREVVFLENVAIHITGLMCDFDSINADIIEMVNGDNIIEVESNIRCFVDEQGLLMEV